MEHSLSSKDIIFTVECHAYFSVAFERICIVSNESASFGEYKSVNGAFLHRFYAADCEIDMVSKELKSNEQQESSLALNLRHGEY